MVLDTENKVQNIPYCRPEIAFVTVSSINFDRAILSIQMMQLLASLLYKRYLKIRHTVNSVKIDL